MSSEDYRTESVETFRSSSEDALHGSESEQYTDQLFPESEVEKDIEDEHFDDFKPHSQLVLKNIILWWKEQIELQRLAKIATYNSLMYGLIEILVEAGRRELRPLKLSDCYPSDRPGMYLEILPKVMFETVETETGLEEVDFPKPIFRLTIDQGTIASIEHASSSAQTHRSKLVNAWSQYEPRLCSEEDHTAIIESESFNNFLKFAEKGVYESLIHNKTADSFSHELRLLHKDESFIDISKESVLTITGSFACFEGDQKQIINHISWHPVMKDIFIASTICYRTLEERIIDSIADKISSYTFYVWSCKNQFKPKCYLQYFDEILLHKFNPTMPHVVIGGSFSGQIILWNLDEILPKDSKTEYFTDLNAIPQSVYHCAISNPEHNHTHTITDFVWVPKHFEISTRGTVKLNQSNESYQFVTCGSDGLIKFWDLRAAFQHKPGFTTSKMFRRLDGKWEPFHFLEMSYEEGKKKFSITKFAFKEPAKSLELDIELLEEDKPEEENIQISTEFYAGCDDGQIFCGNFQLYRDDTGKFISYPPVIYESPHSGSITALLLSPFISDMFLSTGARTVCLWKHGLKVSPIYSRSMHADITSAEWSNMRPALFFLGYEDGSVEMWDLLYSIYEPFLIHFVSTSSITAISIQSVTENEHVLAVGDSEGTAYSLCLPSCLWRPVDNELSLIEDFIKKKSSQIQEDLAEVTETLKTSEVTEEKKIYEREKIKLTKEDLRNNYDEFLELEKVLLRHLGLSKKAHRESFLEDKEEI